MQETQWMSNTRENYVYSAIDERGERYRYNIWYYPWHGRGFLQLTNPGNYYSYFAYRGRSFDEPTRVDLVSCYNALANNRTLRFNERRLDNRTLYDTQHPNLTEEVIGWRNNLESGSYEPADSAGFYWSYSRMAEYADQVHNLERIEVNTDSGSKVYYRSPAFW